jgi:hypothetical protein
MDMPDWQLIWGQYGPTGFFLLSGAILCLLFWRRWRQRQKKIALMGGEFGSISLSMDALREILANICEEVVERPRSKITVHGKKNDLRLRIRLRVPVGENVQEMAHRIQRLAAEKLRGQLGLEQPCSIDILIGSFRSGKKRWGCGKILEASETRSQEAISSEKN